MSLERYMAWKFPNISPQIFRDMDLILKELKLFGLNTVKELDQLVTLDFEKELQNTEWRSSDGIIRNILIIQDADKYFTKVWNPSMNQMNKKNFKLYQKFNIDIQSFCEKNNICVI